MDDSNDNQPEGGRKREHWGTRLGVILAVTGSAVGLGNFLRFPGKAAQYEGGAFMIPYFIALLLLGLPIAWAEWAMGRHGGVRGYNSVPGIFRVIWKNRFSPYLGALGMLIPVVIYMYYVYIEAWCLGYAFKFLRGGILEGVEPAQYADKAGEYFGNFTGINANGLAITQGTSWADSAIPFLVICFVLNFSLIYMGIKKGIERFCLFAMPALVVCAFIVLLRVLTLGTPIPENPEQNLSNGLGFMWNPTVKAEWIAPGDAGLKDLIAEYAKLTEKRAAADAGSPPAVTPQQVVAGQWEILNTAAFEQALKESDWKKALGTEQYRNPKSRLLLSLDAQNICRVEPKGFWRSLANAQMWLEATGQIFFSLSVGFGIIMCYSSYLRRNSDIALSSITSAAGNEFCEVALGGMIAIPAAFMFMGAAASQYLGSSFALGFNALPIIFQTMHLGQFVGFVFFFLLFLAAITSSLSMLQPAIALLEEGSGMTRKTSVAVLAMLTFTGSALVVYFSQNLMALDTMDFWVGTFCIYILATIQVIMFGWGMGVDAGYKELNQGAQIRIPRFVMFIIKYVSPVYLLGIFAVWIMQQVKAEEGNYFKTLAESTVAQLTVVFMALVFVFFLVLISDSVTRWRQREEEARP